MISKFRLVTVMLMTLLLTVPILNVHASGPTVNSGQNIGCSTITCTVTLVVSNQNDGFFIAIAITDGSSAGSPVVVISISDAFSDVWIRDSHVAFMRGGLSTCSGICLDAEVWSTQTNAIAGTSIAITITLNRVSGTTVSSIQGFDVSNIFAGAVSFATGICQNDADVCHGLQTMNTSTSNPVQTGVTFELAALSPPSAVFNQGSGGVNAGVDYTIFYTGIFGNNGGGEYSLNAPSPTTYDFTVTLPYHAGIFALAGATYTSMPTVITQTNSTTVSVTSSRNDTLLLYLAIIVIFLGLAVGIIRITRGVDRLPEAYQ